MNNQDSNSINNSVFHVHQDQNPFEFTQDDPLFNFSSHLLDQDEFLFNILPYQTPSQPSPPIIEQNPQEKGKQKAVVSGSKGPNRKGGKKDRHSKIYTAQGPRDRRMRLSLQVARKFFDLQDVLGFDKASKTIEWLFNKSKSAIKDLTDKSFVLSSHSQNNTKDNSGIDVEGGEATISKQMAEAKGGQRTRESRAKAREWARKRTKEKLMMKNKKGLEMEQNPRNPNIRVNNNYEQGQIMKLPLEDQMASVGIIERFLASSSSSTSHFHHDCDNRRAYGEQIMMGYNEVAYEGVPVNWGGNTRSNNDGNERGFNSQITLPNYAHLGRHYNQGL